MPVPSREKYVPKHRSAPIEPALKKGIRKSFVYSGVAVAVTGVAVSSGIAAQSNPTNHVVSASLSSAAISQVEHPASTSAAARLGERATSVSRSDRRPSVDPDKAVALDQTSGGQVTRVEHVADKDPHDIARAMLPDFGFSASEFGCLDALYTSESGWNPRADNPTSSAYGIPQALTGGTHVLPSDYMTNPVSQIRWGLEYIRNAYGTPCSAWSFKQGHNWY